MNGWQIPKQIRYRLRALVWPDGVGDKVLAGVVATAGAPAELLGTLRQGPVVVLGAGEVVPDDATGSIQTLTAHMTLMVAGGGDRYGQGELLGGPRAATDTYGQGSSDGRGLLEVEEVVLGSVRQGGGDIGLSIQAAPSTYPSAGLAQGQYVTTRDYSLRVKCLSARYYHPPQRLTASGNVLSWALPPDRFDRYRISLRWIAGAVAPASPTAGAEVVLSAPLATSVNVTGQVTAGTRSFALFCAYDETWDQDDAGHSAPSQAQRHSAQEIGSYRTVTVS